MRILQFAYSLGTGGAERLTVDLCNQLAENQNEVYLCLVRDLAIDANDFYLRDVKNNVNIINLKIPKGFSLRYFVEFFRVIRKIKPDVVHAHLNLINYLFVLSLLFRKLPFFHTIHNEARRELSGKIELWIRKFFYRLNLVRPVSISGVTTRSFIECYGYPPFAEIVNGRYKLHPSEKIDNVRSQINALKINDGTTVFLHAGRFAKQKNQQNLIDAFNRLISEKLNVILIIIGNDFDTPEAQQLLSTAKQGIYYLGAINNVEDYFYSSDAFCLTSTYEGLPITLIEAFCCGCVPICTPVGGIVDLISSETNGILSADTSLNSYYDALMRYLALKPTFDRRKLVEFYDQNLSIEICARKYYNLYQSTRATH